MEQGYAAIKISFVGGVPQPSKYRTKRALGLCMDKYNCSRIERD
jgi:hypothetical protein